MNKSLRVPHTLYNIVYTTHNNISAGNRKKVNGNENHIIHNIYIYFLILLIHKHERDKLQVVSRLLYCNRHIIILGGERDQ